MHERVRGWDQGVNYIRTGFPVNNGVTFTKREINEHMRGLNVFIALNIQYLLQALFALSCTYIEVFSPIC